MRVVNHAGPGELRLDKRVHSRFAHAHTRLARRVAGLVDASGRAHVPVAGRILETALTLRLLRLVDARPDTQDRLSAYLHQAARRSASASRRDEAARIEKVVLNWLFSPGEHRHALDEAERAFVAETTGFVADRKRWATQALALIFDVPVRPTAVPTAPADPAALWVPALLSAFRVLATAARAATPAADDVSTLCRVLETPGIWERQILTHLIATHAVQRIEGGSPRVHCAIDAVLAFQRPDGSIPNIPDEDTFSTAIGGLALEGRTEWSHTRTRMAAYLAGEQHPDGGWGFTRGVTQSDVDDTSLCLELLGSVGPAEHKDALQQGEKYLLRLQNGDGGFPTWAQGAGSEAAMTAAAVNALTEPTGVPDALAFLYAAQLANGAFPPGWSRSEANSLFRAALACRRHPPIHPCAEMVLSNCVRRVLETQNPDGGWGQQPGEPSDTISTAFSLITLCQTETPVARPLTRGLDWHMSQQDPNGGFAAPTDSRGPRPFLYDAPERPNLYALLSYAHVAHRWATGTERRP
ncbi:prenyltransferase/squalene oxidase repeat-containing protein [Streptomyces sp. NPDC005728]|uniref:prenyltransferase/squalene oxidase repeat-containing protein n=1 Tax=Streptomyces sp. NPDC005728 TaxID=3157054 RepID=UPI00340BD069